MRATDRFEAKAVPEPMSGCWLWTGSEDSDGYGQVRVDGRLVRAHRRAYELHRGPIPPGLLVRHRCDTPSCVNPDHLVLGTPGDNARDKVARGRSRLNNSRAARTTCPRNHPYDEANTYRHGGQRFCRACNRESHRRDP